MSILSAQTQIFLCSNVNNLFSECFIHTCIWVLFAIILDYLKSIDRLNLIKNWKLNDSLEWSNFYLFFCWDLSIDPNCMKTTTEKSSNTTRKISKIVQKGQMCWSTIAPITAIIFLNIHIPLNACGLVCLINFLIKSNYTWLVILICVAFFFCFPIILSRTLLKPISFDWIKWKQSDKLLKGISFER